MTLENTKYPVQVISVSNLAVETVDEDRSGPVLRNGLADLGFTVMPAAIIPSVQEVVTAAIKQSVEDGARIVVTTGGTGVLLTDKTVEATRVLLDYEIPGIMEEVRRVGAEKTSLSLLSRGLVGVIKPEDGDPVLVINAPGSRGGARDTLAVAGPMLGHILGLLDGGDHDFNRPDSV